jgi:hypothetical protein
VRRVTIQATDGLIYEGVPCRLMTEVPLPSHARLTVVPDVEARASLSLFHTTACWRNFVAVWEIHDGYIYLNDVVGMYRLKDTQPLAAEWVNGELTLEEADVITDFWDVDYNSGMPRAFTVSVRAGHVLSSSYVPRGQHAA